MGLIARLKQIFSRRGKTAPLPPTRVVPVRRPPVEVAAKELAMWAPPPEIVEGPLTPLEIVMAATERVVAAAPSPPIAPVGDEVEAGRSATRPLAPGERIVYLVFADGSMVRAEETSEAARLAYLGQNILEETRPASLT